VGHGYLHGLGHAIVAILITEAGWPHPAAAVMKGQSENQRLNGENSMNTTHIAQPMTSMPIDQLCINTIRTLSIDAVQQAKSGHPGTPMALAPLVYALWNRVLRFDPQDPIWLNRDRFVFRTATLRCCSGRCCTLPGRRR
jgi:hypothetical protein